MNRNKSSQIIPGLLLVSAGLAEAARPVGPDAALAFDQIVLGDGHGCGRSRDGQVACWGASDRGQTGVIAAASAAPRPIALGPVAALSAGERHTCAVGQDGAVWCWGDNGGGQLGGPPGEPAPTPRRVDGLGPAMSVAAGAEHTCAVLLDGHVSCWGDNLHGQLGVTGLRASPFAIPVPGITGAFALAAGHGHTCAAVRGDPDDRVVCWGEGAFGELGRPASPEPGAPADVAWALGRVRAIDARDHQTCALTVDGVVCWGLRAGEARPPEIVAPGEGLVTLAVGWGHGCALAGAGTVTCWGDDAQGQLGARVPVPVVRQAYGLHDAVAIAAGRGLSCAARGGGRSVCWGSWTADELAAARQEEEVPPPPRKLVRQHPPGTTLLVQAEELLTPNGARPRIRLTTVEPQTCANAQIAVEATVKRRTVTLELGEIFLPDGACIAASAPASATWDLPADTRGRTDVLIRWRKKEDFFQIYVTDTKIEAIPLQSTFALWSDDAALWRVPAGSLAISCVDRPAPLCERRARDGLPTCAALYADPRIADAPTLPDRAWANRWFGEDPAALLISPDFDHDVLRALFTRTYADGSGCMDLSVRTWTGETWTNQ